jgi:hypothetical protein
MREFARMLQRHQGGLMNYFRMPIHNGTVKGLNNKAKMISHHTYGFRTAKSYIRNLYQCMAATFAENCTYIRVTKPFFRTYAEEFE